MEIEITTIGELLIDMVPGEVNRPLSEVRSFWPKPGGAPANVAVAASRLGSKSAFIGKVGRDQFGEHLAEVLAGEGVDLRGLRFDDQARTTLAFIALPEKDSPEFIFYRNPGADQQLRPDELDLDLLGATSILHFGTPSLSDEPVRSATRKAVRIACSTGALISCDVNFRPALWKDPDRALEELQGMLPMIDLIKVNQEEAALLTGGSELDPGQPDQIADAARSLLDLGPSAAVITLGAAGSAFQVPDGGDFVPGFAVDSVDPVGCGDAFAAGLLTRLAGKIEKGDILGVDLLREALRFANAAGALTSLKQGAIPAMPDRAQVQNFLESQG